jgi:hypothetical protein
MQTVPQNDHIDYEAERAELYVSIPERHANGLGSLEAPIKLDIKIQYKRLFLVYISDLICIYY